MGGAKAKVQLPGILLVLALLTYRAVCVAADTAYPTLTLITDSHEIRIVVRCSEGEVSCDRVSYHGIDTRTGKSIRLTGSTLHTTFADGVTPCRFLGYRFRGGNIVYSVLEDSDGETGTLVLSRDGKVLPQERGVWRR